MPDRHSDIFTFRSPDDANLIDGSIGEASPFHQTFNDYGHGVAEETATLPEGWKDRLIPFRTPGTVGATGLCLEAHDLAVSKLVAGRDRDVEYVGALIRQGIVDSRTVAERLDLTGTPVEVRDLCRKRLACLSKQKPSDQSS